MGKPADKLALIEIVDIIDGQAIFKKCMIRLEDCNEKEPCSAHNKYGEIRKNLIDLFQKEKISDFVGEIKKGKTKINL